MNNLETKFEAKFRLVISKAKEILSRDITRKSFLKILAAGGAFLAFSSNTAKKAFAQNTKSIAPRIKRKAVTEYDLTAVTGKDPEQITRKSVALLGGMGIFVKKDDVVVVKPNIGWNRGPEYAANTNPEVVAAVVKMCFESGAKTVKVFDNTCNDKKLCYANSGIMKAAKDAGATVFYMDEWKYAPARMAKTDALMQEWPIYKDAVECDVFINVPIAKTHGLGTLTLSIKNVMGVCGGARSQMHWEMDKKLLEVYDFLKPDLNIIDAYNILTANGPRGGNLADVARKNTIIASVDPVLADCFAAKTLFNIDGMTIPHIRRAADAGLGSYDIGKANIRTEKI
ncbi:MAG: DUF362 domain-containing protein [Endomicrobia bacterium]|nr:DUF362 domain-containing protein [Endomicrobiia bacterium]MCL2799705.1 DUF362 domain-containing protein [Endomicrobiia bacterium]